MQPNNRPSARELTRVPRLIVALGLAALIGAVLPTAASADPGDIGHLGPSYSGAGTDPSGSKPESKLWYNDGFWWGSLWDTVSQDFHIHRLDLASNTWVDTGVQLDDRSSTRADTLWDGTKLYVASHRFSLTSASGYNMRLYRFSYNATTNTYTRDTGYPVTIHNYRTEALVIDKDSTGMLWATWVQGNQVFVSHSSGADNSWVTPYVLPGPGTTVNVDDISSVVAFRPTTGPGRIGVMWSNQVDSKVYFAQHVDGAADTVWDSSKTAIQGPGVADDHINLKSVQSEGGKVYAAIKTGHSSGTAPLIMVLVFDPAAAGGGSWSSSIAGRVPDAHTRPIVVIDEQHDVAHVVMTGPQPPSTSEVGGSIYEKTLPLSGIGSSDFPTGAGTPIIRDADVPDMNDATSTKQNVTGATGLVILAGNATTNRYWWSFDPLGGPPPPVAPVAAFSGTPTSGSAPLTVNFTDASTNAPTAWAWDFQNDGIVDSNVQNPAFTYTSPGTYTVKLTASNTAGPDDEVKTGYVTVGAVGSLTFVTFTPEADAFVNEANATRNYGHDPNLRVNNSTTDYRSYLKFTTSGLAGPVGSVHLRLFVNDTSPDGGSVYAVSSGWTETGITWNIKPALPPTPIRAIGATPAVGQWVDVDLGSAAITGNGTFSFAIANNSTNSAFYSSRQGTNPPQLIVGYESGPPPPAAPVAQFTADTTSGAAPLTVQFTDTSSNTPTGWSWAFGDGGTSTEQSPSHQYTAAGTYTVSLTATNLGGSDNETKTGFIKVYVPPVAQFSGTPLTGNAPHTVQFTDASTNTPTSWSWAFGDGGTSTAQSPGHQYTAAGTYTVSLTATNPAGSDIESKTGYITVTAPPSGGTITVIPTADSRVSQQFPTSNYGGDVALRVRVDPTGDYRSYLRFSVAGITSTVRSVKLRLFVTDASPVGGTVYPTSNVWTEPTINWNNKPLATGPAIRTIGATPAVGNWVEVDLTGAITTNGSYDFLISDGNTNSVVYSSEEGANPPQLVIVHSP